MDMSDPDERNWKTDEFGGEEICGDVWEPPDGGQRRVCNYRKFPRHDYHSDDNGKNFWKSGMPKGGLATVLGTPKDPSLIPGGHKILVIEAGKPKVLNLENPIHVGAVCSDGSFTIECGDGYDYFVLGDGSVSGWGYNKYRVGREEEMQLLRSDVMREMRMMEKTIDNFVREMYLARNKPTWWSRLRDKFVKWREMAE
jgi:hypothetical protein